MITQNFSSFSHLRSFQTASIALSTSPLSSSPSFAPLPSYWLELLLLLIPNPGRGVASGKSFSLRPRTACCRGPSYLELQEIIRCTYESVSALDAYTNILTEREGFSRAFQKKKAAQPDLMVAGQVWLADLAGGGQTCLRIFLKKFRRATRPGPPPAMVGCRLPSLAVRFFLKNKV